MDDAWSVPYYKKNNIGDPLFIGLVSNDPLVARKSALVFFAKKINFSMFLSKTSRNTIKTLINLLLALNDIKIT